jgi:hypothetical protein
MDRVTGELWQNRRPPFDGVTLSCGHLRTEVLRAALEAVVRVLRAATECRELSTFVDWHEHDAYRPVAVVAVWQELEAAVMDEASLQRISPRDDDVRRAWLAGDRSFYLRWSWYAWTSAPFGWEPAHGDGGDLDVTAAHSVVGKAKRALDALGVKSDVEAAQEFFARRRAAGPRDDLPDDAA